MEDALNQKALQIISFRKVLVFIILLGICCNNTTYAQGDLNVYDSFFYDVKQLEYEKAKSSIKSIKGRETTHQLLEKLTDLLYDAGQNKEESFYEVQLRDSTLFGQGLRFLIKGYKELYYHSTEIEAFKSFREGYILSQELGYKPLEKQFLLGLLEQYHSEVLQSNEQFHLYLSDFKQLVEDDVDRFRYLLYTAILNTKTLDAEEIKELSSAELNELTSLVEKSKGLGDRLLTTFYYEKAIHYGFDADYNKAKIYYAKVIPNCTEPFMKYMLFGSYLRLVGILSEEKELNKAMSYLDSVFKYRDRQDTLKGEFYIDRYKSTLYGASDNYNLAYSHLMKSLEAEYSMDVRKNAMLIAEMNVVHEAEKKEQELIEQRQKTNLLILAFGFILLIAILFFKNVSKKRKLAEQEQEIQKRKVATLLKEQELVGIDAMIEGQEKERQKVANELHDDLGSQMATAQLYLENVQVKGNIQALDKAREILEESYQKVRQMAHSKNSGVMASQGLVPAIQKMAKTISESNAIQIEVHVYGLDDRMENTLELTLFRIIQELTTNIIKHAEATQVNVQLTQHEESLNILVEDNGKGFQLSEINTSDSGMGLRTIEKRIEHLEGSFTIDSILGKGTSIIIDVPMK